MVIPRRAVAPALAALALAFAALLALGLAGCGPKQVEVPDLAFMESAEAEKALTDAGLKLGAVTEKEDADVKLGDLVLEQSAAAGSKVDEGSAVDVTVSKGPKMGDTVKVPDLTGMTVEEAEEALAEVLLVPVPGEPTYSDAVEPGKVCAQSLEAESEAKVLDDVTYSVSIGKEQVAVPDVAGKTLAEARDILAKAGLGVDTTTAYDDKVAKDSVVAQSVKKDEKVDKGTVVTLTVSLGAKPADQVAVPNIITFNLSAAKATLESAGLKCTYTGDESGTVSIQNPAPGTKVDQGTTVTVELKAAKKTSGPSSKKDKSKKVVAPDGQNPAMNVVGPYASGRATMTVEASGKSDAVITVEWANSASSVTTWTMSGAFDDGVVKYSDCTRVDSEYGSGGAVTAETTVYTDGKGSLTFRGSDVTWDDEQDHVADGMTFTFAS